MIKHLQLKHPYRVSSSSYSKAEPKPKFARMDAFLEGSSRTCNASRADKLNNLICLMIVKDLRPLSTVEGDGFKSLISFSEPGYNIPGRTFFTFKLRNMYANLKDSLKTSLASVQYSAVTTDIWTSPTNDAYMSVTLHFVDNWELRHRVIAVLPVDDRHTGDNIVNWLLEVLDRYDFTRSKVVAVVHDNGSNIVSAAKKLNDAEGWCSVRCAAHTIQLVVGAALKVDDIQQALVAARRVVEYFKRSVVATSALREKQEQMSAPCHKLVMEVSTRWNSTLYMVRRLLEQRWPVCAVLSEKGQSCKSLNDAQWEMLSTLAELLEPFEAATVFVSGELYVTASAVASLVLALRSKMRIDSEDAPYAKEFKRIAVEQIDERWPLDIDRVNQEEKKKCSIILKAALLDPRFKLTSLSPGTTRYITEALIAEALQLVSTNNTMNDAVAQEISVTTSESINNPSSADHDYNAAPSSLTAAEQRESAIDDLFDVLSDDNPASAHVDDATTSVDDQLASFLREPRMPRKECPLTWWNQNVQKYKYIAPLAVKYLCIPGSSAPSERAFSIAGITTNRLRCSLLPENVEMLVVMHYNYDLMSD